MTFNLTLKFFFTKKMFEINKNYSILIPSSKKIVHENVSQGCNKIRTTESSNKSRNLGMA